LAEIQLHAGEYQRAAEHVRQALELAERVQDRWAQAEALLVQAGIAARTNDREAAVAALQASLDLYRRFGHRAREAHCLAIAAHLELDFGSTTSG
jgi:tetratricopeptide (TPR) repeat protein